MKLNIDKNLIVNLVSDSEKFTRGMNLFLKKSVTDIDYSVENRSKIYRATVEDAKEVFQVNLKFDFNGNIKSYNCSCEEEGVWSGACQHITSVLFYLADMNSSKVSLDNEGEIVNNVLEKFKNITTYTEKKLDIELTEKVNILPVFSVSHDNNIKIGIKIGVDKFYKVKNIKDFLESISKEEYVSYGKTMAFKHSRNKFSKVALEMINIISQEQNINGKDIIVSDGAFEEIFEYAFENGCEGAILATDSKPIKIKIEIEDESIKLINSDKNYILKSGKNNGFVILDNIIYKVDKDYFENLSFLNSAFVDLKRNILPFAGEDVYYFLKYVLPNLDRNSILDRDYKAELEPFGLFSLVKKLYFDTDKNMVICKVLFCYGDEELTLDTVENWDGLRQVNEEQEIIDMLTFFGFERGGKTTMVLKKTDNIFNFSLNGIERLRGIAEIFVTKNFKTQNMVNKSTRTKMDIKLKDDYLNISLDNTKYSLDELIEALASFKIKKKYHRLRNGTFINLQEDGVSNFLEVLDNMDDFQVVENEIVVNKNKAFYLNNAVNDNASFVVNKDENFNGLIYKMDNYSSANVEVPSSLDNILREYQKEGFRWLENLSTLGFGGILADDMGLGKTIQVITLLEHSSAEADSKSIIVCPTSLIYNWQKEIEKFAPNLETELIIGSSDERQKMLANSAGNKIFITTYDMLKRDLKHYKDTYFKYVIIDEAQYIKNPSTQASKSVKKLKKQSGFALTGTPIENSLIELWSIFDFIIPGYLRDLKMFQECFVKEIVINENQEKLSDLKKLIWPFILRRLKVDVLKELPEKIETNIYTKMTADQELLYTSYFLEAKGEIDQIFDDGFYAKNTMNIITKLTRLRQLACHPSLFLNDYYGGSGKLDDTIEIIQNTLEKGNRILLFSQFTSMLEIIKTVLDHKKIEYFYLDGKVKAKDRDKYTTAFNNGEKDVFLISLKAGGTGLNLVGANVVIHFDPWWNPAVMSQATDRAHRYGQEKTVQIFNMISQNSIEEKIFQLQERKKSLIDSVISEGGGEINSLSKDDIKFLFSDWEKF